MHNLVYPNNVESANTELASLEKAESELMEIEREIDSAKKVFFSLYWCNANPYDNFYYYLNN